MSSVAGPNVVDTNVVLYLDAANPKSYSGTGTTWYDISGNNNNATLTNGPTFDSANMGSLVFDGSTQYATCNITCDKTYYSINWWLYPNNTANYNQRMSFNDAWNYWVFHTTSNGAVYVGTSVASRMTPTDIPANTIVANAWQNLTYVFNNGEAAFYKNGNLVGNKSGISVSASEFGNFWVGSLAFPGNTINGKISSVQVYNNKVLSASEVQQNFNALRGRYGI